MDMYKKIVVALGLDHGHGVKAIDTARKLLAEGGEIVALHVIEPVPGFVKNYVSTDPEPEIRNAAEEAIAERIGERKDAEAVVLIGYPGPTVTEYAETIGADCIIVGSNKPELRDYLLGSTAARIVRHAPCSVHVLR